VVIDETDDPSYEEREGTVGGSQEVDGAMAFDLNPQKNAPVLQLGLAISRRG